MSSRKTEDVAKSKSVGRGKSRAWRGGTLVTSSRERRRAGTCWSTVESRPVLQLSGVLLTTAPTLARSLSVSLCAGQSVGVVATDSFEIPRKPSRINARRGPARRLARARAERKSAATNKHAPGRRLITAHLCRRSAHRFRAAGQSAWSGRR